MAQSTSAPTPDLRILETHLLRAHEDHDSQRALPLIERLGRESVMINPPLVAPMGNGEYVILDGANRVHAFHTLGYPHILVQVVDYANGQVELSTWSHVVSDWQHADLIEQVERLERIGIDNRNGQPIAHLTFPDAPPLTLTCAAPTATERVAALRRFVGVYQQNARLHRTALESPQAAWPLYPTAIAFVAFATMTPHDIITAAREDAFLPPGVSRHIVHGRAVRVNYPMDRLRTEGDGLTAKNEQLRAWFQEKLENRHVRYYAESTYAFDE